MGFDCTKVIPLIFAWLLTQSFSQAALAADIFHPRTEVSIRNGQWHLNGIPTHLGTPAEGLLPNMRMVNAVFEDINKSDFDPLKNTSEFIEQIPVYVGMGVTAFTIGLQGGMPGYEGAINSAFAPDGALRPEYLRRVADVIEACDRTGAVVILSCYYQRQDQLLRDEQAVRAGIVNVVKWLQDSHYRNVLLEIANESGHSGFDHAILKSGVGQQTLIQLAHEANRHLLVSTSGLGDGKSADQVAEASDFLLVHFNSTPVTEYAARAESLRHYGKPIVCNEDDKVGAAGAAAARRCVELGISWGGMLEQVNQHFPFRFEGRADDLQVYDVFAEISTPRKNTSYFPPPESSGGWRKLTSDDELRRIGEMDPDKLRELQSWLMASDNRDFAAVVIRHGHIVLEVERGNSAVTDARRVASVSKAVCATVLAIASQQSQAGKTPRRMNFDDPAFEFIPWGVPLRDARKGRITVQQLLNHTSGICPEATGAPNDGTWEYILGHSGDPRTEQLAFDPGSACGYSTHGLAHAALVCENVTGKPYDQYAIETLFQPIGCEHWWFQIYGGDEKHGRHPSHGMGMPARDLARIAYCMLQNGLWQNQQVIPRWFVAETAATTHHVTTPEMRWKLNPRVFSHGWELPARHWGKPDAERTGDGIPADARAKPGSGGQIMAFIPSLDLVVTRQTGSSGDWQYEEVLRRACAAVIPPTKAAE